MSYWFTRLFPVWAIIGSWIAYAMPELFRGSTSIVPALLGVVMLAMGLTLTWKSFAVVWTRPRVVLTGVLAQYTVMPGLALGLALLLGLTPELTAGFVLVGSCPGGTASNLIAYLSGAEVALSISLTAISTILSVVLTPSLTWLLLGERVDVPFWDMLADIAKIVLLPVLVGVIVNSRYEGSLSRLKPWLPAVSVAAIVWIIAIVVAVNADELPSVGITILFGVCLHNLLGLGSGYAIGRGLGYTEQQARTLAIEVGMQNSGLGAVLAHQYFGAVAALPSAIFSIWHNLSGSLLAVWLRNRPSADPADTL